MCGVVVADVCVVGIGSGGHFVVVSVCLIWCCMVGVAGVVLLCMVVCVVFVKKVGLELVMVG